ncbi:hypothetical protein PR202_ga07787 [Eleusine coracana subsp. coracana]|uniref:BED-type domain-containing protein n=1 Tax=Eleusine coracana subsp. coracana TaxID=191504 RepID=A0AAV5BZK3_ELECO|nr:hypothetical protein PR202_ga07787 [Eleusine coracana subsp. coracana]
MATPTSSTEESSPNPLLAPARSDDPAWAHAKVVVGFKNKTICLHCGKQIGGGGIITRLKYHLAGLKGQVEECKKVPPDVRWQMKQLIAEIDVNESRRKRTRDEIGSIGSTPSPECSATASPSESRGRPPTPSATRPIKERNFFAPRTTPGSQPCIKSALSTKDAVDNAKNVMARWWYDANIPFNAANSPYYQPMIDAIAAIGPGFGKEIASIVLGDSEFWDQCQHVVMVTEPLVRVLRLVDGDEKPCMGYLYEAMDKAKENIEKRLRNKPSLYGPYIRVIDARWDKQLHSPLHAAGCFLNPGIYFNPSFTKQKEVGKGLTTTIMRLVADLDVQDKVFAQLEEYKRSLGYFGTTGAIRQREKLNPVAWWENFGHDTPDLQAFAVRVLSQCCSATGCERKWSIFEHILSKRRSRLEHSRLNDLVFVRYNLKLRERIIRKSKAALDPISLDNIDLLDEWVSEEPALLTEDDLNWESIDAPFSTMSIAEEEEELGAVAELILV